MKQSMWLRIVNSGLIEHGLKNVFLWLTFTTGELRLYIIHAKHTGHLLENTPILDRVLYRFRSEWIGIFSIH